VTEGPPLLRGAELGLGLGVEGLRGTGCDVGRDEITSGTRGSRCGFPASSGLFF
jgi:hypothetical protein